MYRKEIQIRTKSKSNFRFRYWKNRFNNLSIGKNRIDLDLELKLTPNKQKKPINQLWLDNLHVERALAKKRRLNKNKQKHSRGGTIDNKRQYKTINDIKYCSNRK